MVAYVTIRGETLARMPGIDPADIPGLLQMLVSTACGPEQRDIVGVTHAPTGLEMLWVEEIADLRGTIAAQEQDGLTRGLTEPAAEVIVSLQQAFMHGEIPGPLW